MADKNSNIHNHATACHSTRLKFVKATIEGVAATSHQTLWVSMGGHPPARLDQALEEPPFCLSHFLTGHE